MAPLSSDPRQIVIALNPARREALLKLVDQVTSYMVSELESSGNELELVSQATFNEETGSPKTNDDAKPEAEISKTNVAETKKSEQQTRSKASRRAQKIQKSAVKHMNEWKQEFMPKLEEIVRVPDDVKIREERRKRAEALEKKRLDTPEEGEHLINFGEVKIEKSKDLTSLQELYDPIPTRLREIPQEDRREAIACILLLLLSTGKYSAHSRALALYLASALDVPPSFITQEEVEIAKSLIEAASADDKQKEAMSAEAEAAKRRQENKFSRFWKVGLASVAGATIIGVTGGLAAPIVAGALGGILGGVGLGGVASFLGIFWMNGALVGALFGAYGAKMTGTMMDEYAKEVEDFRFIPLKEELGNSKTVSQEARQEHRLRVTIGINGWLDTEEDITRPWRVINDDSEVFALRYELKTLMALGSALQALVQSWAWNTLKLEVLKRTVLATLLAALWPIQVLTAASNVDNPFNRAHNRSRKAGKLLADALINKVQGERPVTLVGYSLGATTIHSCLQSLAEREAFGLIDTVVLIGAPAPSSPAHWRALRTVVSGRIFNVFSENDMVLGFMYRAHSLAFGVAGLQAIKDVKGVENLDLSEAVSGHLRYPNLTGQILLKCGFLGTTAEPEIEKDDLIKMKENQGEGNLIDLDQEPLQDAYNKPQSPSMMELNNDLRDINISPPGLTSPSAPPPEEAKLKEQDSKSASPSISKQDVDTSPPLPRRPTVASNDEQLSSVPRRPTQTSKDEEDVKEAPALPRQPTERAVDKPLVTQQARPLTPDSNASDDEDYGTITMVDNDSSDDDDLDKHH